MQRDLYKKVLERDMDAVVAVGGGRDRGRLLNVVMQLRKATNHPYLFEGVEDRSLDPMGSHLIDNCGKLVLLDKLLPKLQSRGSRVLIFSQMTRLLDILEDYCEIREYDYCRLDGSTSYAVREESIDAFNAPNSKKFIFLLSTRAGGLGINLATADTVILYDSDWNPQVDLQAQDRAHRIGQTKPVNIFRLVTEDSVEEKIIERAEMKLRLDAVVIQQGRLADQKKKLSKDEMVRMIRYGAEKVFRSKDSTITDDDIDAIMSRGERKTADMNSKLQEHVKGDMLDFKLEYSTSMQKFDGIDYSKRNKQEEERRQLETLGFIHKISDAQGKRQRTVKTSYNDNEYFKSISFANPRVPSTYRHGKGPRWLKLPPMQFWRMYSAERIGEIHAAELQLYEKWVRDRTRAGEENPRGDEDEPSPLATKNPDMYAEKQRLLAEGFPLWSRMDYIHFYKACAQCGRENYADIAKAMNLMLKDKTASLKTADDVEAYSLAFWSRGRNHFQNFSKMVKVIEKGEKKLGEMILLLLNCLKKKIAMYKSPHEQFEFHYSGANNSRGKNYTMNADVCLLLLVQKHGFGQWDAIRSDIQRSKRLCFEYFLRTRTNRSSRVGPSSSYALCSASSSPAASGSSRRAAHSQRNKRIGLKIWNPNLKY